jgi:hypothetical protein
LKVRRAKSEVQKNQDVSYFALRTSLFALRQTRTLESKSNMDRIHVLPRL